MYAIFTYPDSPVQETYQVRVYNYATLVAITHLRQLHIVVQVLISLSKHLYRMLYRLNAFGGALFITSREYSVYLSLLDHCH